MSNNVLEKSPNTPPKTIEEMSATIRERRKPNKAAEAIKMPDINDLFSSGIQDLEEKEENIVEIALSKLKTFKNHPFLVSNRGHMQRLKNSIQLNGVIEPIIIRPLNDGYYEIVSGHCRVKACKELGQETIRAHIIEMTDDEAIIKMVDSNIHRLRLLPSERGKAYRMKYDAIKRQGYTKNPQGASIDILAEESKDSRRNIQRLIKISYLNPALLTYVDCGKIGLTQAYTLAFLSDEEQALVAENIRALRRMTNAQATKLREFSGTDSFNTETIQIILYHSPELLPKRENSLGRPKEIINTMERAHGVISLPSDRVTSFFPEGVSLEEMTDTIIDLLEKWKRGESDVTEP